MSVKKFKFVSPGVFVDEIDNSGITDASLALGPVIIGRTERGPAMRPVRVNSFSEFIDIFGNPVPGNEGGDIWRKGNRTAPTYAAYAAQAWLRNNSPCTIVRLAGFEHTNRDSTNGQAGWTTQNEPAVMDQTNGGAYGLFIVAQSGAVANTTDHVTAEAPFQSGFTINTGALAAVWYLNQGSMVLSGAMRSGSDASPTNGWSVVTSGSAVLIENVGDNYEFKAAIRDGSGNETKKTTFNFNENSNRYIRRVFNTNPTKVNSNVQTTTDSYFLGETYERHLKNTVLTNTSASCWGVILALATGSFSHGNQSVAATNAKTGWYFSQDMNFNNGSGYAPDNMQKLFRFHSRDWGVWNQNNLKISVGDFQTPTNDFETYGTFTITVRKIDDTDGSIKVVEKYALCNLNPDSSNYIAKKIGDKYQTWDDESRRWTEYGNYSNTSDFIRVQMNEDVDRGIVDTRLLPYGTYGPLRFSSFTVLSGALHPIDGDVSTNVNTGLIGEMALGGEDIPRGTLDGHGGGRVNAADTIRGAGTWIDVGGMGPVNPANEHPFSTGNPAFYDFTASFVYPAIPLRQTSLEGNTSSPSEAYFGVDLTMSGTSTRFEESTRDILRAKPNDIDSHTVMEKSTDGPSMEYQWVFTMDDLTATGGYVTYSSGSRAGGTSITAFENDYKQVLTASAGFTTVLYGGSDGLDITEREQFNNSRALTGKTNETGYAFNSVNVAIDSLKDPEVIEYNMAVMPGITEAALTDKLVEVCTDRGDALAIIDIADVFNADTENKNTFQNRVGAVQTAVDTLNNRQVNSSYACTYYPWVQIRDTISDSNIWVPPSVIALGVMASSERRAELWFAPAGFNRGGLTEGAAGLPVLNVSERLIAKDRDKLYAANINPIATFPAEGIVVFGQKTLQVTQSALDRINVRRLMIFVKKEISRMATTVLFDQNVRETWNRFLSQVEPFLDSIKARLGLLDFRVVLDESTTTADLIDRNIMYAKIFLKPARSIEFIALDFVVTNTGAAFED